MELEFIRVLMVLNVVRRDLVPGATLLVLHLGIMVIIPRPVFPSLGEAMWVIPFRLAVKEISAGGMLRLLKELDTELPLLTELTLRLIRVTRVFSMVVVGPF